jgi:hypothetical protein
MISLNADRDLKKLMVGKYVNLATPCDQAAVDTTATPPGKCPFRRDPRRKAVFQEHDGFWWSGDTRCWMVSEPRAITHILKDKNFSVHPHSFSEIAHRLGITFVHQKMLRDFLPLAVDGEDHTKLRCRFDNEISKNTNRALTTFENHLVNTISVLIPLSAPSRFCVAHDLLKIPIRLANFAMAGVESCNVADLENLPLFFDRNLSLKKRRYVEQLIADTISSLPQVMTADEKYFRIAMLAVNMNTVLGSILDSFLTVVKRNADNAVKDMDWDNELLATALPMIERKAIADSVIFGRNITAGDVVRLFLDVDGFDEKRGPRYSSLYFAAGPHKCPGMNYSRKLWNILTRHMKTIDKRLRIHAIEYRSDTVFNILQKFEVELYA